MKNDRKFRCLLYKRYAFVGVAIGGNGKNPTITAYEIRGMGGLLENATLPDIRNMGNALLINLRPSDERLFVEKVTRS